MANHYTLTSFLDNGLEKSAFKLFNGPITVGTIAGFLAQYAALKTALDNITIGTLMRDMWVGDSTLISQAQPASKYAQRETKLLLTYEGQTSHKLFTATVPTVDLNLLTFVPGGKDAVSLVAGAEMIALKAAIEAMGKTPDNDAEAIVITAAKHVGRNI